MNNPDEVQPIDGYVRMILEQVAANHNLEIDLENPTRGQRLEAALAIKDDAKGFSSMEIMVGHRVGSTDEMGQTFAMLRVAEAMNPRADPRKFYSGFGHQYRPERQE